MCNDLEIGKDFYPEVNNELTSINYSTNILTLGFWKNYMNISLNLPNELIKYKLYNKHYSDKNKEENYHGHIHYQIMIWLCV